MLHHSLMRKHSQSPYKAILTVTVLILCLALTVPVDASADETPEVIDPPVSSSDPVSLYQLPTVTVTADKRATDVQKTPSAITVMTDLKLEDASIDTIEKVLQRVPNLNLSQFIGGASLMSIRGTTTSPGTNTSPIVMYLDGVPVDTYFNLDAPMMDVERVEILRGPQSAIYGKNAMGGVINVISRKPDNDWRGSILTEYGSFNTQKLTAALSGPIIEDRLFFALSGMHSETDGYMNHDDSYRSNKERDEYFKGQLRFTPTDKAEVNFHINYSAKRDGFSNAIWGSSPTLDSPVNPNDYLNSNILNMALHTSLTFDPMIFESITTYRKEDLDYTTDMAFVYNPLQFNPMGANADYVDTGRKNKRTEFTQEFRLKSPDSQTGVTWLAGVYGGYTDMNIRSVYSRTKVNNYPYQAFGSYVFVDGFMLQDQPSREYVQDYAAFGEISVPLTDAFRVTAALRGQYTHKKISVYNDEETIVPAFNMSLPSHMDSSHSDSWQELLPKLNLSYQFTDDVMVYAGVNRSFIPGGFNNVSRSGLEMEYDSQTAWNYEIGAKTEWFDKRFALNVALFYSDFDDLQIFKYDAASMQYLSSNAGSAKAYGIEVDAIARILPGLDAEFSYGYTKTELKDYHHMGMDYSGNKIPYTPEYTASFALQYRHESGVFARGEVIHYGSLYWGEDNADKRGEVTLLNARVGYEYDEFGVYVYGNNLGNEKYLNYYTATSNIGMMARPREVGVQVQYRF